MRKINRQKAYTFAEVMISLSIWAAISVLTVNVLKGTTEYVEKVRYKNVTLEFKNGLNRVMTNPYYYPGDSDLANIKEVKIENDADATYKSYKNKTKFRGLLLKELDIREQNPILCYMMTKDKTTSLDNCYRGANNVIWGIPDTDFDNTNIVNAQTASGSVYKYVPVTIYPDSKHYSSSLDFDKYAIVYGVRRDGDITMINNVDCSLSQYKDYNQCKFIDLINVK